MRRLVPYLITALLLFSPGFAPAAAAVERPKSLCSKLLQGTGNVVSWPFKRMKEGYKLFWAERLQQGRIRWLLAPRYEGFNFNKRTIFNPLELSVEVLSYYTSHAWGFPVLRRPSRWVSFPVANAVYLLPFIWLADSAQDSNIHVLENNLRDDRYGAAYITDWIQQEKISLADGTKQLILAQDRFGYDMEPLRLRAKSFVQLGLWTEAQLSLSNLILNELRDQHSVTELMHDQALKALIGNHPRFPELQNSIPGPKQFTIELWVQPEFRLKDKSDAEWLALLTSGDAQKALTKEQALGIQSLWKNHVALDYNLPLTTLAAMTADSVANPDLIKAKMSEAVKLSLPADAPFIYRADFPIFQSVQTLHELTGDLVYDSELELWSLIHSSDPRFAGLLPLLQETGASEFAVLYEVSGRLQDLNRVFELYGKSGDDLAPEEFCPLIYGANGMQPNTYFVSLQGMESASWQAVFADINYDSLVESSRAENPAQREAAIQRGAQRTAEALSKMEQGLTAPSTLGSCATAK